MELPTSAVVDMDIGQVTAGQALPVSRLANFNATHFSVTDPPGLDWPLGFMPMLLD